MTNLERIKAMNAKELAAIIMADTLCETCIHHYRGNCDVDNATSEERYCYNGVVEWLESETE